MVSSLLLTCIGCKSNDVWKYGFYRKYQVYKCKSCGLRFTNLSKSKYARHRFKQVIVFAITLYRFGLSGSRISYMIKKQFGIKISDWTICVWFRKFGNCIRELLKEQGIQFTKVWHVDEMWLHAKSIWYYLYVVIDSNNNLITMYLSPSRDMKSTKACFKQAKQIAGKPDIICSDGMLSYPRAIRSVFGRKTKHIEAHFKKKTVLNKGSWHQLSNNRIEGWNSWFRPMYRRMRGFKSVNSMNKFLLMFTLLYNLKDNVWDFLASW